MPRLTEQLRHPLSTSIPSSPHLFFSLLFLPLWHLSPLNQTLFPLHFLFVVYLSCSALHPLQPSASISFPPLFFSAFYHHIVTCVTEAPLCACWLGWMWCSKHPTCHTERIWNLFSENSQTTSAAIDNYLSYLIEICLTLAWWASKFCLCCLYACGRGHKTER